MTIQLQVVEGGAWRMIDATDLPGGLHAVAREITFRDLRSATDPEDPARAQIALAKEALPPGAIFQCMKVRTLVGFSAPELLAQIEVFCGYAGEGSEPASFGDNTQALSNVGEVYGSDADGGATPKPFLVGAQIPLASFVSFPPIEGTRPPLDSFTQGAAVITIFYTVMP